MCLDTTRSHLHLHLHLHLCTRPPPPTCLPSCLPAPQISALQIESTLLEHPDIAEVAVFGVPDEAQGEVGVGVRVGWCV